MDARPARDHIDVIVDRWYRETPNFDPTAKQLAIRLPRVASYLQRVQRRELAEHSLEPWEFEILIALRHAEGQARSAGDLLKYAAVTSGAISNRLARLEDRGWVRRDIDPKDRRHVLVSLTPAGLARTNQLLKTKSMADDSVFRRLDAPTREQLNDALRTLLIALEGHTDDAEAAGSNGRGPQVEDMQGGELLPELPHRPAGSAEDDRPARTPPRR